MYSIPKFNKSDFDIRKLLPKYSCSKSTALRLSSLLHETVCIFVGAYADKPEFHAGKTKKDLNKISTMITNIRELMQTNPNILDFMILKSGSILDTGADIDITNVNNFNSFFIGMHRMCSILEHCCNKFENSSGGRYKNNILSRENTITIFVANLQNIYKRATKKKATGNYTQAGITNDTPFMVFTNTILSIINTQYPNLNDGYGIHFSVMDTMRKIGKK